MKCSYCNHENRDSAKFCTKCGTALILVCPMCHTPANEGDIYCSECGFHLPITKAIATKEIEEIKKPIEIKAKELNAERKNISVLFGDLSGFTAMSEKLDPEEVTTIMNACLDIMGNTVTAYEGYIDKFIGDCIMALFGAPITHENDPELAIRAALEMNRKIKEYNKELPIKLEKPLSLHIGINTGLVVAGQMGSNSRMDYTVMGDTVNLASRLESKATAGQVFVSAYTYNQTKNLFEFIEHEPMPVKGKKEPVAVYEVVRALDDSEIRGSVSAESMPLIGRKNELEILSNCAERLKDGEGQAIFLISDPGFGKSRIQIELKKIFKKGDLQLIESRCHSFSKNRPYHTFIDLFKRLCAIDADDLDETIAEKLTRGIPLILGEDSDILSYNAMEAIVLIGKLFNLDLSKSFDITTKEMSPEEIYSATIRSISWIFATMAKKRPIILSIEDMRYADSASVEVVASLIKVAKDVPIMLMLMLRPDKESNSAKLLPLARRVLGVRAIEITFKRLPHRDCEAFVKYLLKIEKLPRELSKLINARSDGNPLFIQEILHSLLDSGAIEKENGGVKILKDLSNINIPTSITGLIMARFDQLPPIQREIMSKASVIGPTFSRKLISAIMEDSNLDTNLNELIEKEMIFESQSFPDIEYTFHTTFIQEAVYATLLLKHRQKLHLEVANTIFKLFNDRIMEYVEALAYHYVEARDCENAYKFLVQSAIKNKTTFVNESASNFFKQAIEVAPKLKKPNPPVIELQEAHSEVLELLGDMDGAIDAWQNVINLSDDIVKKADAMRNIGRIEEKRGLKDRAIKIYEDAMKLVKDKPDSEEYALILMNLSWVLNRFKKVEEALQKAHQALEVFEKYDMQDHIALCCNNLSVFYEAKEEFDTALEYNLRSLAIFKELNNQRQIGNLHLSLGYLYTKRNEMEEALKNFSLSAETMGRIGNRVGSAIALLAKGRCYADMGNYDSAEMSLLSALRQFKEMEMDRRVVATEVSLINVFLDKKETSSAFEYINEAKEIAKNHDFDSDLGKLARLEGRAFRFDGKEKDSDKKYGEAIEIFTKLKRKRDIDSVSKEWKGI